MPAIRIARVRFYKWFFIPERHARAREKKNYDNRSCCCASPCKCAALTVAAAAVAGWLMDSDLSAWRLDALLTKWLFNNGTFWMIAGPNSLRIPMFATVDDVYARWILNSFTTRSLVREIWNHFSYTARTRSAADKLHLQKSARKSSHAHDFRGDWDFAWEISDRRCGIKFNTKVNPTQYSHLFWCITRRLLKHNIIFFNNGRDGRFTCA